MMDHIICRDEGAAQQDRVLTVAVGVGNSLVESKWNQL